MVTDDRRRSPNGALVLTGIGLAPAFAVTGEVRLRAKCQILEYAGSVPKGQADPDVVVEHETWLELDSDPPFQTHAALNGEVEYCSTCRSPTSAVSYAPCGADHDAR